MKINHSLATSVGVKVRRASPPMPRVFMVDALLEMDTAVISSVLSRDEHLYQTNILLRVRLFIKFGTSLSRHTILDDSRPK